MSENYKKIGSDFKQKNSELKEVIWFNSSYNMISPYADTTVVKSPRVVLNGIFFSKYNRFLSEEYLLNYRTPKENMGFGLGISNYQSRSAILTLCYKHLKGSSKENILLPKPKKLKVPLGAVIKSRRSIRKFTGNTMTQKELSTLLYNAIGISGEIKIDYLNKTIKLHTSPSGGGLNPITLYVGVINVKGIESGIYSYHPYTHSLYPKNLRISLEDFLSTAEYRQLEVKNSNILVFYVFQLYKNSRKYGDSGLAYAFIEAGEISQNIALAATGMGYGACDVGGYYKQKTEKLLKIDGLTKHLIHLNVIGEGKE